MHFGDSNMLIYSHYFASKAVTKVSHLLAKRWITVFPIPLFNWKITRCLVISHIRYTISFDECKYKYILEKPLFLFRKFYSHVPPHVIVFKKIISFLGSIILLILFLFIWSFHIRWLSSNILNFRVGISINFHFI